MADIALASRQGDAAAPLRGPGNGASSSAAFVGVHLVLVPALLVFAAWSLQHGNADLAIASLFYDGAQDAFGWRDSLLLDVIGHQAARALPIAVGAMGVVGWISSYVNASLRPWRAILLSIAVAMLVGPALIGYMKSHTSQHCPVDILEFGGVVNFVADRAEPFWSLTKQGAGRCLPSGHAGGGYALFCLYFAGWASGRPAWRWAGLAIGVAAGLSFSVVRMMQGAHFASATMWSAAIDWTVCALVFFPVICRPASVGESH